MLRTAGRGALTVLRRTTLRAKLGSLHLPMDLHPGRQRTILLPPIAEGMRALRCRLGASERRVARLRQALDRERRARQQGAAALVAPDRLIEHLVAGLEQADVGNPEAVRATISRVLAAHGIAVPGAAGGATSLDAGGLRAEPVLPVLPGWDPARLTAIVAAVTRQPEIGGVRTLHLALSSMAGGDPLDATEAARQAGLTSGMGRHRMRLALEGLCARGVLRRQGERFSLRTPDDQGD